MYNFIATATKTLDMTMYELVDTTAEQDPAAKKGAKVRVILDQNLEKSSNTTAFNYACRFDDVVGAVRIGPSARHGRTG